MNKKTLSGITLILLIATVSNVTMASAQVDEAIDKGLTWLAAHQAGNGQWGSSYPTAETAHAVLKFEEYAYEHGMSPFDPGYMYTAQVTNGLNFLFTRAVGIPIGPQPYGNPDTNNNGQGIYFLDRSIYETSCAMMAIAGSRTPTRLVTTGPFTGLSYFDVLQDTADFLYWGQNEPLPGRGGWGYNGNDGSRSDQSNTGWATFGIGFAISFTYGFLVPLPPFVVTELSDHWINYIQNTDGLGGYVDPLGSAGYTDPHTWVNVLKAGHLLYMLALVGDPLGSPRVQMALDYLVRHWNDLNDDPGWRGAGVAGYHAMFNVMKGLTAYGVTLLNGIDWTADFEAVLLAQQLTDGSWPLTRWDYSPRILSTTWALLTLERVAPPPVTTPTGMPLFSNILMLLSVGIITGVLTIRRRRK